MNPCLAGYSSATGVKKRPGQPGDCLGRERAVTALPAEAEVMRLTAAVRRAACGILPPCAPLSQKNDLSGLIWQLSAPAPWLGPLVSAKA
jgi:hypothetical protein